MSKNVQQMVDILVENYSPSELEEEMEITLADIAEGLDVFVENNFDRVKEVLEGDLFI